MCFCVSTYLAPSLPCLQSRNMLCVDASRPRSSLHPAALRESQLCQMSRPNRDAHNKLPCMYSAYGELESIDAIIIIPSDGSKASVQTLQAHTSSNVPVQHTAWLNALHPKMSLPSTRPLVLCHITAFSSAFTPCTVQTVTPVTAPKAAMPCTVVVYSVQCHHARKEKKEEKGTITSVRRHNGSL